MKTAFLIIYNPFPFYLSEKEKEQHYHQTTRSIISSLYAHPNFPFCIYLSKVELVWLAEKHPEILDILDELANQRKQLEFLGGPSYEPFLSMISGNDRMGQLESNTIYLREKFGKKPKGVFLPYGIWESTFPSYLKKDFEYTFLPSTLLIENGINSQNMSYFYSEDDGKNILVFPYFKLSDKEDFFITNTVQNLNFLTIFFDGSNINYLNYVLENIKDFGFELTLPSTFISKKKNNKPIDLKHINSSSAKELSVSKPHVYYKQWLFSFKASHIFYSRMLYALSLIKHAKLEKRVKDLVLDLLWQTQNHQLYWDSLHGGIENPLAREWGYSKLLQIDNILRGAGVVNFGLLKGDFKMEGSAEVCYQGLKFNAFIQNIGGVLYELDYLDGEKNYLNFYDSSNKEFAPRAFMDYITLESKLDDWTLNNKIIDDFSLSYYDNTETNREKNQVVYSIDKVIDNTRINITKKYLFTPSKIELNYTFINKGVNLLEKVFATELNFSLNEDNKIIVDGKPLETNEISNVKEILAIDDAIVRLAISEGVNLKTKKSYNNFDNKIVYQGESLLLSMPLFLNFNEEKTLTITLSMESHENNL